MRAAGLAADAKQKISLGRGLVREDVSAVLFDEPLTVIDPHLKWQLRRKLKQIHHELKLTLIYVTHDQVEALTFADQVVVMTRGRAVQIGSASELFERPAAHLRRPLHRLAGHELPAGARHGGGIEVAGQQLALPSAALRDSARSRSACGPSTWRSPAPARQGAVPRRRDAGAGHRHLLARHRAASATARRRVVRARLGRDRRSRRPATTVWLGVVGPHTCFYQGRASWIAGGGDAA